MKIGEKIKRYREASKLTQKQVALRAGMSEPAIRNYELGNRTPSEKQIEKIALALNISPFAISNPNLDSYVGMMHTFFYLEEKYGLIPAEINGEICLKFQEKFTGGSQDIETWYRQYQIWQNASKENAEEAKLYYERWKSSYPKLPSERSIYGRIRTGH